MANEGDSLQFTIESAKEFFFDREAVLRAVDASTRRLLSRFGAYTRQRAKGLIRSSKKRATSKPGRPPLSHVGLLKKHIYFAADVGPLLAGRGRVVVGPVRLSGKTGEVPSVLEHGGTVTRQGKKQVYIQARPYMRPAFDREIERMKTWADK